MPEGKTQFDITFKVTASNRGGIQGNDDAIESEGVTITIYEPGIKMQFPEKNWVPAYFNSVKIKSELQYKSDGIWQPALAHMSRILFFELLDVSRERGIAMNEPLFNSADNCFDLQFMNSEIGGQYEVFAEADLAKKALSNCQSEGQYMMVRTVSPVQDFEVDVYSNDFGAYGFLRSFANRNTIERLDEAPPLYTSIPWLKTEVFHPLSTDVAPRLKANQYTDNRVNIPLDIDENHIPDFGWISINGAVPDLPEINLDEDDTPEGNKTRGDGLSVYEEYRGFVVLTGKYKSHVRTSPAKKDIFIFNRDHLDISLFKTVTGLEVHEVAEENILPDAYQMKAREINFNCNDGSLTHLVGQRGLRLIDAEDNPGLLGIACPSKECPLPGTTATPNWIYEIRIFTKAINRGVKARGYDPKLKLAQVVAHELCHGINICHHGEGNPNIKGDFEKPHGLRSGDINCVMRYDNSGVSILGKTKEGAIIPVVIGSYFGISPDGTGYNTPGHFPGFDNATPGRGNCLHQMQVTGTGDRPVPCKQ